MLEHGTVRAGELRVSQEQSSCWLGVPGRALSGSRTGSGGKPSCTVSTIYNPDVSGVFLGVFGGRLSSWVELRAHQLCGSGVGKLVAFYLWCHSL